MDEGLLHAYGSRWTSPLQFFRISKVAPNRLSNSLGASLELLHMAVHCSGCHYGTSIYPSLLATARLSLGCYSDSGNLMASPRRPVRSSLVIKLFIYSSSSSFCYTPCQPHILPVDADSTNAVVVIRSLYVRACWVFVAVLSVSGSRASTF